MFFDCGGYKSRYSPKDTIERVRTILKELGILARENWGQGIEGRYYLRLQIDGTEIFANGKGNTPTDILADAYIRLLECLQNLKFIANGRIAGMKAVRCGEFCFAPDEQLISIDELMNTVEEWITLFTGNVYSEEKRKILKAWQSIDYYGNGKDFISLPYINISDGSVSYIPWIMAETVCGISAACSADTKYDALLEGLCEVTKKYAMRRLVSEKMTPPTVPKSLIKEKYPAAYIAIKRIESKGEFRICIKDCSAGEGLPVLGIVLTDRKSHSYNVRLEAHPVFGIALEKCLNSLLQGNSLNSREWLKRFTFTENEDMVSDRLSELIIKGSAESFPAEFFEEACSYDLAEIRAVTSFDSSSMLSYMLDMLYSNGCNIMLRDVSFLGFPSYRVIAAFSGEEYKLDRQFFRNLSEKNEIRRVIMRCGKTGSDELERIARYMSNLNSGMDDSIVDFLYISSVRGYPWGKLKKYVFLSLIYYKTGKYQEAYNTMSRYLYNRQSPHGNTEDIYLCCVRDYYGILASGINDKAGQRNYLSKFYPDNIVDAVFDELGNPDDVLENFPGIKCFECEECLYKKDCSHLAIEGLYLELKNRYTNNPVEQENALSNISFLNK